MAESSLSLAYPEVLVRVARYLGLPSTPENEDLDCCHDAIDSGLRNFYQAHNWHFLVNSTSLSTVADTPTVALPDNFASAVALHQAAGSWYPAIRITSPAEIRQARSATSFAGRPFLAAVTALTATGTIGQRFTLELYPTPDAIYSLLCAYRILPEQIRVEHPYPLGGAQCAEAILASCLAAAELQKNDEPGPQAAQYQVRLAEAIQRDNDLAPQRLGYNGDEPEVWPARSPTIIWGTNYGG